MTHVDNDRWRGVCTFYENATYEYTVEAWTDTFRSWQHEFTAKFEGGITSLQSEALEGAALLEAAAQRAAEPVGCGAVAEFAEQMRAGANAEINAIAISGELRGADGDISGPRPTRHSTLRLRRLWSIVPAALTAHGMNSFRARPRAAAIADRLSAIALPRDR